MKPEQQTALDRVLAQIALAKSEAITAQTKMPYKRQICRLANVYLTYFSHAFEPNQKALAAYELAKAETATTTAKTLDVIGNSRETLQSKERQLIAHLQRFGSAHLRSLHYKLDLTPLAASAMVKRLAKKRVIQVNRSPFDKYGKEVTIVLAQSQQKVS